MTAVLFNRSARAPEVAPFRYLAVLRFEEIVVLQGAPLLGAALAMSSLTPANVARVAILVAANICLVAHIFMLNDWAGLTTDLSDPNRASFVFTARGVSRNEIIVMTGGLLAVSLVLLGLLGARTFWLGLVIAALSALYSLPAFNWKGRPFLSSIAHLLGGALHFLLGYSIGSAIDVRGAGTAVFFALTFAAGHLIQEIRDYDGDVLNGIRTNAVMFGWRRTFMASLVLFTAAYAVLAGLAFINAIPRPLAALVVLYPFQLRSSLTTLTGGLSYASIRRLQWRYRAIYTVIGVAMVLALVTMLR